MTRRIGREDRAVHQAVSIARKYTKHLVGVVASGGSLPEMLVRAYLMGAVHADQALRGKEGE